MNENIDLTKILKNCPKETEFWSKAHGAVYFQKIDLSEDFPILVKGSYGSISFSSTGQYFIDGECLLIPSKDQRDWSKFTAPWYKKEKFDPKTLQSFDRVLVRDDYRGKWICSVFSHISEVPYPYCTASGNYLCCIPYNDETKHLAGTKEEAPEFYKYWEN